MNKYLIAIGSNLGDKITNISSAIDAVQSKCGSLLKLSKMHCNPGKEGATGEFLNGAMIIESIMRPEELMDSLLLIERNLGRIRIAGDRSRSIDLDIILGLDADQNPILSQLPAVKIPHPRAQRRDFVLVPSAEIAADWIFSDSGLSVAEALALCGLNRP